MTRSSCAALSLLLAIAALSCSGRSATSPDATPATTSLAGPLPANVALFDLRVDAESTTAEITPIHTAAAQPPQNLSYDLDIARYITPQTLSVAAVRKNDFGDVVVRFRHQHPFPAPDFALPITGKNRADLSYTGRLMILADENQQSLNTGSITVDPWVVREVDGYMSAGDLLRDSVGLTNTHFPYMLLADEAKNNREGVSNGALASGNYDAASGGWQRANAGADGKRWTGFDYIHGGQAIQNEFTVRWDSFTGSSWNVRLAVVIQYTDPRGLGGLDLRFPPETVDVSQFAYRLPHAALDVSRVSGNWDLYMHPDAAAVTYLDFRVRDWDAEASVSADDDLSDETDVAKIQPSGGGDPSVQLVLPALLGAPLDLATTAGTGVAGNELRFQGELANDLSAAPGEYWGALVVTDPEASDPNREDYHFGVDPITFTPYATRALEAMTIIPVRVTVAPDTTSWGLSWGDANQEFAWTAVADSEGNVYVSGVNVTPGTDFQPGDTRQEFVRRGYRDATITKFDHFGNRLWTKILGVADDSDTTIRELFIAPNDDLLAIVKTDSTALDVDPGPGTTTYNGSFGFDQALVMYSPDGEVRWIAHPEYVSGEPVVYSDVITRVAIGADGSVSYCGYFTDTRDFDSGPGTAIITAQMDPGGSGSFVSLLDANGEFQWVRDWGTGSSTILNWMYGLDVRANGDIVTGGLLWIDNDGDSFDLDPGAGEDLWQGSILGSAVLCVLGADGDYVWGRAWGTSAPGGGNPHGGAAIWNLASDAQNHIYMIANYFGEVDFDAGPGVDVFTAPSQVGRDCIISYSADGDYRWAFEYEDPESSPIQAFDCWVSPAGNFTFAGLLATEGVDFDPGPGTRILAPEYYVANLVASYNSDGELVFAELLEGAPGNLVIYDWFSSLPDGRILGAGGARTGDRVEFGSGTQTITSRGLTDGFFAFLNDRGAWE